jgi:hypothetical protein
MKATIHLPHFPLDHPVDTMAAWEAALSHALKHAWDDVVQLMTSSNDVKVWKTRDRHGNEYWNAYDPITDAARQFSSEAEVRVWLEDRYYR